jgi:hypothetical protein
LARTPQAKNIWTFYGGAASSIDGLYGFIHDNPQPLMDTAPVTVPTTPKTKQLDILDARSKADPFFDH